MVDDNTVENDAKSTDGDSADIPPNFNKILIRLVVYSILGFAFILIFFKGSW
jgi:hypothetical protein